MEHAVPHQNFADITLRRGGLDIPDNAKFVPCGRPDARVKVYSENINGILRPVVFLVYGYITRYRCQLPCRGYRKVFNLQTDPTLAEEWSASCWLRTSHEGDNELEWAMTVFKLGKICRKEGDVNSDELYRFVDRVDRDSAILQVGWKPGFFEDGVHTDTMSAELPVYDKDPRCRVAPLTRDEVPFGRKAGILFDLRKIDGAGGACYSALMAANMITVILL